MKKSVLTLVFGALLLSPLAMADNGNHYGWEKHHNHGHQQVARKNPNYRKGDRLPIVYVQSKRYYVSDWRDRGLQEPPRDYRWVKVDDRYILASVLTGVISNIILAH